MLDPAINSMVKENGDLKMQKRNHQEIEITKVDFVTASNCNWFDANSITIFSVYRVNYS